MPSSHVIWFVNSGLWLFDATIMVASNRNPLAYYAVSLASLILGTFANRRSKR